MEARLWGLLRAAGLGRFKFRRQHPIGPYITDFCCEEVRLVLEVDGDTHAYQQEYDASRTAYLAKLGYKVLRVTNRDVLHNEDGVLQTVLSECEKRRA